MRWTNGTDYWQFSFSDFENNYKRYFSDEGFGFTTLSTSIRGTNTGNYHERNNGTITGIGGAYEWGSENHTKLFNEYGLALQGLLERTGMLDKTVLYPFDEPLPADYEYLRDLMGATHKAAPKLRRFLTTEPVSDLYGYVDVWCPKQDMVDPVITAQRQLCAFPLSSSPFLLCHHVEGEKKARRRSSILSLWVSSDRSPGHVH